MCRKQRKAGTVPQVDGGGAQAGTFCEAMEVPTEPAQKKKKMYEVCFFSKKKLKNVSCEYDRLNG